MLFFPEGTRLMKLDLQKASMLKRVSAWLLDMIFLMIVVVGAASLISVITGFDNYNNSMEGYYEKYESAYGVEFNISGEAYNAMTEAERKNYDDAYNALIHDDEAMYCYNMVVSLTLLTVSLGILIGYLVTEFLVPIILKNGQTVGKRIFGIAVVRTNFVKMNNVSLFIRTILGKYTLETMIPVLVIMMIMFGMTGLEGTLLIVGILITEVVMLIATKTNSMIHDKLADTVTVDLASQLIFDTEEGMLEYKKRMSAENAARSSYF